jgi:hypothetical protein
VKEWDDVVVVLLADDVTVGGTGESGRLRPPGSPWRDRAGRLEKEQ